MKKIFLGVLILAMLLSLCACGASDTYDEAMELYEDGKYEKAYGIFKKLDGKDAKEMSIACRFQMALEEKNYTQADELSQKLEKYSDDYRKEFYDYALELLEKEEYADALSCFRILDGYSDGAAKRKEAAMKLLIEYTVDNGEVYGKDIAALTREYMVESDHADFTDSSNELYLLTSSGADAIIFMHMSEYKIYIDGAIVSKDVTASMDYKYAEDLISISLLEESEYDQTNGNDFSIKETTEGTIHVSQFNSGELPKIDSYLKDWSASYMDDETEIPDDHESVVRDELELLLDALEAMLEEHHLDVTLEDMGF